MDSTQGKIQDLPEKDQDEFEIAIQLEFLKSEDQDLREIAAVNLGRMEDGRAVEPLIQALRDPSWEVRFAAAESLGLVGDGRALRPLIECLDDRNGGVRQNAMEAILRIGTSDATDELLKALTDSRATLRKYSIQLLAELQLRTRSTDTRPVEPLLNALKDPVPNVREAAAAALREFPLTQAEGRLVASLKDERFATRFFTVQKLTQIGGESVVAPLLSVLEDESIGRYAAEGLGAVRDPRAVGPLVASLENEKIRRSSMAALVQIGDPAVEPLIAAMENPNPKVRAEVAWGLGMLRDPRAVEALLKASEDDNLEVRRNALTALGLIRDGRAVGTLIAALEDEASAEDAKEALVPIGEPAVAPLLMALKDATGRKRRDILWVLGMIRDKRAMEPLIGALEDEDPETRSVAILGLGLLRDPCGVHPLIEAMHEERFADWAAEALGDIGEASVEPLIAIVESPENDWRVRSKAIKALGLIRDARAVDPLIRALQDPLLRHHAATALVEFRDMATTRLLEVACDENAEVRAHAVAALGLCRDALALTKLVDALGDPDALVRRMAARALGQLEEQEGTPALIGALKDSDEGVRGEAVLALALLRDARAVGPLVECLSEDLLREHAAEALFQIGDPAVEPLIAALRKPEAPTTHVTQAVPQVDEGEKAAGEVARTPTDEGQALAAPEIAASRDGETDSPQPSTSEIAEDLTWKIRKVVAWTLGMLRDRRAVEPLLAALSDIGSVRASVIEALGRLEAPEAAEPLVRLMKTDPALRKLTAGSLVLIGEEAVPVVKELLRAPDPDLQAYARYILEGIGQRLQKADEDEEEGGPPMDMVLNEM